MPIARITTPGLVAIALLVAALWGCIVSENAVTRAAEQSRAQSLEQLRLLRKGLQKVNQPAAPRRDLRQRPC
jgi:hypothetical protein